MLPALVFSRPQAALQDCWFVHVMLMLTSTRLPSLEEASAAKCFMGSDKNWYSFQSFLQKKGAQFARRGHHFPMCVRTKWVGIVLGQKEGCINYALFLPQHSKTNPLCALIQLKYPPLIFSRWHKGVIITFWVAQMWVFLQCSGTKCYVMSLLLFFGNRKGTFPFKDTFLLSMGHKALLLCSMHNGGNINYYQSYMVAQNWNYCVGDTQVVSISVWGIKRSNITVWGLKGALLLSMLHYIWGVTIVFTPLLLKQSIQGHTTDIVKGGD